jgi:hypothetical protein
MSSWQSSISTISVNSSVTTMGDHVEKRFQASQRFKRHQFNIYENGMLRNQLPAVTTSPNKLEQQARDAMEAKGFNFIFGGAGEHATMDANRLAFRQWKVGLLSIVIRLGSIIFWELEAFS